ncbi:OsmC family protein [Brachybacterium sp. EF45031]|uniref:OsmC family protein n=1 Tax=Brachybacterium sillae TaxID=2810536 RepID=UPI00217DCF7D|nr:OsmC family protein [Brachybacterium sillae]MCS6710744.1 OsmC family protein [Brachybacterium sillae]
MATLPDDSFPLPDGFDAGSVWADRVGERQFVGRNQRGVEIPIGKGEGQISPGELLKLALIGCAGMSADLSIGRRLGEDFRMRLFVHGESDPATNRYLALDEEMLLDLDGLSAEDLAQLQTVVNKAIERGCTVERTVAPGTPVSHTIVGIGRLGGGAADSEAAR